MKFSRKCLCAGFLLLAQNVIGGQGAYSQTTQTTPSTKSIQLTLNLTRALFKEDYAEQELRHLFRQVLSLSGFEEGLQRANVKDLGEIRILTVSFE
ncbi:MAG: hypothetical protein WCH11_04800, partial [Bdellovibrio sp.]